METRAIRVLQATLRSCAKSSSMPWRRSAQSAQTARMPTSRTAKQLNRTLQALVAWRSSTPGSHVRRPTRATTAPPTRAARPRRAATFLVNRKPCNAPVAFDSAETKTRRAVRTAQSHTRSVASLGRLLRVCRWSAKVPGSGAVRNFEEERAFRLRRRRLRRKRGVARDHQQPGDSRLPDALSFTSRSRGARGSLR